MITASPALNEKQRNNKYDSHAAVTQLLLCNSFLNIIVSSLSLLTIDNATTLHILYTTLAETNACHEIVFFLLTFIHTRSCCSVYKGMQTHNSYPVNNSSLTGCYVLTLEFYAHPLVRFRTVVSTQSNNLYKLSSLNNSNSALACPT